MKDKNIYEIYVYNNQDVIYMDRVCKAGTIAGWEILFIRTTEEKIKNYPFFDCIISVNDPLNGAKIINF